MEIAPCAWRDRAELSSRTFSGAYVTVTVPPHCPSLFSLTLWNQKKKSIFEPKFRNIHKQMLLHPVKEKYSILVEDDKVKVGASSMQGYRCNMEDAHSISLSLPRLPNPSSGAMVAVFDGHNGCKVAQVCATHIVDWITGTEAFQRGDYTGSMREGYLAGDQWLFKNTDRSCAGGSTAITVMLINRMLYCANTGDSRAVLCRAGSAVPLSHDHKPLNSEEQKRIEAAGSFVSKQGRVNGMLSLSRAFGDFGFKSSSLAPDEQAVTVVPDVTSLPLTPDDEFVVLGCDGIWDVMTNQGAVTFLRERIAEHGDASLACEELLESNLKDPRGTDNMTAVVMELKREYLHEGITLGETAET